MLLAIDQGTTGTTCLVFDLQGELHRARLPRVHPALPAAGLGRARRGRDLGGLARGRRRGARRRGPGARRARGRRHHQPARDRRLLGPLDRRAAAPRARLAGPPHGRALRRAARGRRGGPHPRAHRAGARPVLLGDEDRVAAAQRRRARRARPRRARGVRDDRLVAALQAHRRARDGALQRVAHAADGHRQRAPGTPSCCELFGGPRALAARGPAELRRARHDPRGRLPRPRGAGLRRRRRPAGGAVRAALPGARARQEHLRHRLVRAANAGTTVPKAAEGLLATIAWQIGRPTTYALEAAIFVTGAAVQWLRDGLGIISAAAETEELAASLDSNDGVYFVPALTGLGSPHWDPYARGTIVGLTRGSGRAHLARAALEAMAYQTVDAVRAMDRTGREPLAELRADGAATVNRWLMQFQADVLGVPVAVAEVAETTAFGAALLAGVGADLLTLVAGGGDRRRRGDATSRGCARTSARRCSTAGTARSSAAAAGRATKVRFSWRSRRRPKDLAPMKAQVYKDPRPVEYFARFHERSRSRDPDWVYEAVRDRHDAVRVDLLPHARDRRREGARRRRGDPRAEPLLVHGPLLPRRLDPPQGALHGQVAAVHAADAVDLHARRRVPGAARLRRRGRVHHRVAGSSSAAARSRCTARAAARARASCPRSPSAASAGWR